MLGSNLYLPSLSPPLFLLPCYCLDFIPILSSVFLASSEYESGRLPQRVRAVKNIFDNFKVKK